MNEPKPLAWTAPTPDEPTRKDFEASITAETPFGIIDIRWSRYNLANGVEVEFPWHPYTSKSVDLAGAKRAAETVFHEKVMRCFEGN